MKAVRVLALLGLLGTIVAGAWSQEYYEDEEDRRPQRKQHAPSAGFWPTPTMMERFIDRITEDMSGAYDFDEDQLYNVRELWKGRFPTWLNENRAEIMQVTNEYIEALLAGEPPDPAYVADWAQRTLPLIEGFTEVCEGIGEDMRPLLTEEQQVMLDGHLAAFRTGLSFTTQRVGAWSEGGFDPETEWPGSPKHREAERERERGMQAAVQQAEREARGELVEAPDGTLVAPQEVRPLGTAARPTAKPKDEWTKYVEDFIRRYQLSDEQQGRAYKVLRALQEQRDRYLRRGGTQLNATQELLKEAETDEARAKAQERYEQLKRPLDRMFVQLKERLDKLPTRKQRIEAAEAQTTPARTATQPESPTTPDKTEKEPASP